MAQSQIGSHDWPCTVLARGKHEIQDLQRKGETQVTLLIVLAKTLAEGGEGVCVWPDTL